MNPKHWKEFALPAVIRKRADRAKVQWQMSAARRTDPRYWKQYDTPTVLRWNTGGQPSRK